MKIHFRALETFDSEATRSTYVRGLTYTVRPGNELLARLVETWIGEDKVEIIRPPDKARIGGHGKVT